MAADYSTTAVTVGGCRIRLMRGGSGEPLLYLHGASGANWLPFLQKLAKNFDVIAPEHPGFGESDSPAWLDNIHDLAYFYLDALDALELSGVHLVGNSLGGWIAAEMAVRSTQRLASLTLAGSAGLYVPGVSQVDSVSDHRGTAADQLFLRSEQGQGDDRARSASRHGRHSAEEPADDRQTLVAAAQPRSASCQMAASYRCTRHC